MLSPWNVMCALCCVTLCDAVTVLFGAFLCCVYQSVTKVLCGAVREVYGICLLQQNTVQARER
jgi:hypothetical protein